jgi:hypothetical protein
MSALNPKPFKQGRSSREWKFTAALMDCEGETIPEREGIEGGGTESEEERKIALMDCGGEAIPTQLSQSKLELNSLPPSGPQLVPLPSAGHLTLSWSPYPQLVPLPSAGPLTLSWSPYPQLVPLPVSLFGPNTQTGDLWRPSTL